MLEGFGGSDSSAAGAPLSLAEMCLRSTLQSTNMEPDDLENRDSRP